MKYPPSYYNSQANVIYKRWVDGLREQRKITLSFYRKQHLAEMNEIYEEADELYRNFNHNLGEMERSQILLLLSRRADDALYKV